MVNENPAVPRNQTQSVWLEAPVSYNHALDNYISSHNLLYELHNWHECFSHRTLKILHNIKLFPSEATCSKHTFTKISTFLNLCFPLQSRRAELLTNLCVFFVFGKAAPKQDERLHFLQKPGTIIITTWGIMVC